jgi:hypothetical protein
LLKMGSGEQTLTNGLNNFGKIIAADQAC